MNTLYFIYLLMSLIFFHIAWMFYISRDGELRHLVMWLFICLGWLMGSRAICNEIPIETNDIVRIITNAPLWVVTGFFYKYLIQQRRG